MRYFADSFYWIALIDSRDTYHASAMKFLASYGGSPIYTTEDCIVELFDYYSHSLAHQRLRVAAFSEEIFTRFAIVVPRSTAELRRAMQLYAARPDKGYSLTDCLSMNAMRDLGITQVLTRDLHFAQEGFELAL